MEAKKWVDFAYSFWHVNCVLDAGLKTFTERYQRFCKRHHYEYQPNKPVQIYEQAKRLVPAVPKDPIYKELIQDSIQQLNLISQHVEQLRKKMDELASALPEYDTVRAMYGVGPSLGPQLIAEIGDVTRFTHREALTAFAGVDPSKNDSGQVVHRAAALQNVALPGSERHCIRL